MVQEVGGRQEAAGGKRRATGAGIMSGAPEAAAAPCCPCGRPSKRASSPAALGRFLHSLLPTWERAAPPLCNSARMVCGAVAAGAAGLPLEDATGLASHSRESGVAVFSFAAMLTQLQGD